MVVLVGKYMLVVKHSVCGYISLTVDPNPNGFPCVLDDIKLLSMHREQV